MNNLKSIKVYIWYIMLVEVSALHFFCNKDHKKNNNVSIVVEQQNSAMKSINPKFDSTSSNQNFDSNEKCYIFTDLSYIYNYEIKTTELSNDSTKSETKRINIIVRHKNSNILVDSLNIQSEELLLEVLADSNTVRSYITNKNTSFEILDNHYGDVVIEDFNFDSLEDIAVINESGSYSGSRYLFFIQSKKGKFIIDTFLSTKVQFYPSKINRKKLTLITDAVTDNCTILQWIYQYNIVKSKWKLLKTKHINICK